MENLFKFIVTVLSCVSILSIQLTFTRGDVIEIRSQRMWDGHIRRARNNTLIAAQFYVPWCGFCRYMKPEFQKLSINHPDVIFLNVNADQLNNLAWNLGISSVPTYKFFKQSRNVDSISTYSPTIIDGLLNRLKV